MVVVPDLRNPVSFRLDKSTFPVLNLAHPKENIAIKIQINHKKRTDLNMLYLALLLVPGLFEVAGAKKPHPLPVFSIFVSITI